MKIFILILGVAAFIGGSLIARSTACWGNGRTPERNPGEMPMQNALLLGPPVILVPQENTDWHAKTLIKLLWHLEGADEYKIKIVDPEHNEKTLKTKFPFYLYKFKKIGPHSIIIYGKKGGQKGRSSQVNFNIRAQSQALTNKIKTEYAQVKPKPNIIPLHSVRLSLQIDKLPSSFSTATYHRPTSSKPRIYVPQSGSEMFPGPLTILWERFLYASSKLQVVDAETSGIVFDQTLATNQMTIAFLTPGEYQIGLSNVIGGHHGDQGVVKFRVLSSHVETIMAPIETFIAQKVIFYPVFPYIDNSRLPVEFGKASLESSVSLSLFRLKIYEPQENTQMHPGFLTVLWEKIPVDSYVHFQVFDKDAKDAKQLLFKKIQDHRYNYVTLGFVTSGTFRIQLAEFHFGEGGQYEFNTWSMVTFHVLPPGEKITTPINTFIVTYGGLI